MDRKVWIGGSEEMGKQIEWRRAISLLEKQMRGKNGARTQC
jgi:hypothetical protein